MGAPEVIQKIIWAGNELIGLPYIFGGGHASFVSPGYDCSGTVSFALHGAGLLATPEDSSEFEGWGSHGIGRWVAVFSNPGHAYMTVAGPAPGHERGRRPVQPAGSALAPAAPGKRRLRRAPPLGALASPASARLEVVGRRAAGRLLETR